MTWMDIASSAMTQMTPISVDVPLLVMWVAAIVAATETAPFIASLNSLFYFFLCLLVLLFLLPSTMHIPPTDVAAKC